MNYLMMCNWWVIYQSVIDELFDFVWLKMCYLKMCKNVLYKDVLFEDVWFKDGLCKDVILLFMHYMC
jgi:hypothetical protein